MLCCRDFSENNDKEDDDVNSLVVDDKDSAAESTVPCIAISEDLGKISVEVCDSTTMEETKSDLIKSINDYSCLLGNLSDVSEARDLERQLSEEVEKLRGSRAQLVRDVDDLKQESASARTDIDKLSSSIKREFDSTILIRKELEQERSLLKRRLTSPQELKPISSAPATSRPGQSLYSHNPMPNFNFHFNYNNHQPPASQPSASSSRSHQPPSSSYPGLQYNHYSSITRSQPHFSYPHHQHHPQHQSHHVPPNPYQFQPGYHPGQTQPSSQDLCYLCRRPANFVCSACKKVHYCTSTCQVRQ